MIILDFVTVTSAAFQTDIFSEWKADNQPNIFSTQCQLLCDTQLQEKTLIFETNYFPSSHKCKHRRATYWRCFKIDTFYSDVFSIFNFVRKSLFQDNKWVGRKAEHIKEIGLPGRYSQQSSLSALYIEEYIVMSSILNISYVEGNITLFKVRILLLLIMYGGCALYNFV